MRTLPIAVLALVVAAAPAGAQTKLQPGAPVTVALSEAKTATLRFSASKDHLVRVRVTALDGAAPPELGAKVGRESAPSQLHRFEAHSLLEWPMMQGAAVELTIAGSQPGASYAVKLITERMSSLPLATRADALMPLAFAPTAWFRLQLSAGTDYLLDAEGCSDVVVFDADGKSERCRWSGEQARWSAAKKEAVVLRVRSPRHLESEPRIELNVDDGKMQVLHILEDRRELREIPPPETADAYELDLVVKDGEPGLLTLFGEQARTYVIDAVAGGIKDPVLAAWDQTSGKLVAWDDDGGDGLGARLRVEVKAEQSLEVQVQSLHPGQRGRVKVKVRAQ